MICLGLLCVCVCKHQLVTGCEEPRLVLFRECKDVVFEDVVFDNNRFYLILYLDFT